MWIFQREKKILLAVVTCVLATGIRLSSQRRESVKLPPQASSEPPEQDALPHQRPF
jgi:hypothetical protein